MATTAATVNAGIIKELNMPHPSSIRDELEADAWRNHAVFARRLSENRQPVSRQRRSPLQWQDRALLIIAAFLLALLIIRVETARAEDPAEPFYGIELQDGPRIQRAVALDTDIKVVITGLTARVDVLQVFQNTGGKWSEALYRYPLPAESTVDRLRVYVGDRLLEGEIQEKAEARRQYQQAKSSGKVASLVEQQRANQFETRLANIGPGEGIGVSISFMVPVDYRDGSFSLRLPMTSTPRWDPAPARAVPVVFSGENRFGESTLDDHRVAIDIDLRSGMTLSSLESRYHDVDIHPSLNGYRIFLADPDTRTDRVFELNWTPEFGAMPESTLSIYDAGDAVYAMLMLAPPVAEAVAPQPREVVFIIDTSGSMEGTSLEQAKAALKLGLEFLGPDDSFNLVRFSSDSEKLFRESVPAFSSYREQAFMFIDGLSANGGTMMAPALEMAFSLPRHEHLLRQVIFITDGSVGNDQELLLQVGEQLRDSRLFTVSIGSAPNEWFMRKAAEFGRGSHTHIGKPGEVEERMAGLWNRIQTPAVQDLCVDWGMEAEFYPEVVPDLYAGEPLWLYARLPRSPQQVTLCGELDGQYWEMTSRSLPGTGSANLSALWAGSKIRSLQDSRIFGADAALIRAEILDLALDYGLLTQYTSLVAVDKSSSRPGSAGLGREDVPSLLPAGSGSASGFSNTASGWVLQLVLALLSLLVATGMLLFRPPSRAGGTGGDRSPMASALP
ncbi:MAG: marine proteobacterial sortase target protein [Xanthomonadales bacterium]|nr:marine proteobacterial sortase target protein [Gammaproteobacteria bacterium]NNK51412.1 marine proteobacterial sortase target protein [Xanthomonadales bacterium]